MSFKSITTLLITQIHFVMFRIKALSEQMTRNFALSIYYVGYFNGTAYCD